MDGRRGRSRWGTNSADGSSASGAECGSFERRSSDGFAPGGGAFASHLVVGRGRRVEDSGSSRLRRTAASIPVVFGTAYHALHTLARLRRGETVLIHAAAGGVGLAAVQLAQQIGATVLATAGSDEKRDYFRSLGVAHVMDSRTLDFADETLRFTGGRGVDVVLNSLAGAFQQKSLAVCAPHGRFVEIGKRDLFENQRAAARRFSALALVFRVRSRGGARVARQRRTRALRTISRRDRAAIIQADSLRRTFAAQRRSLRLSPHAEPRSTSARSCSNLTRSGRPEVPAEFWPRPRRHLSDHGRAQRLRPGDRALAGRTRREASRAAQPPRPASAEDAPLIEAHARPRCIGRHVFPPTSPMQRRSPRRCGRLQKSAPPLRGVFHSAMVLRDRFLADMTPEDLAAVLAPKVGGRLEPAPPDPRPAARLLRLFSSISSLIGAPGQANYAAANAFLDALAHHRRAEGLPALSVNWGQIADVGVAAEQAGDRTLSGRDRRAGGAGSRDALATLPG